MTARFLSSIEEFNPEVFYCREPIQAVDRTWIDFLKKKALLNTRKRARMCHHHSPSDFLHEMLIVMHQSNYVRPHKHLGKAESFHLIEGAMDVIIFDDDGTISQKIVLDRSDRRHLFYYRLSTAAYHTIIIRSEWIAYHEVTTGPFLREDTIFPDWAPDETNQETISKYLYSLKEINRKM